MRYRPDGSPIPSHVASRNRPGANAHYNQFRLMKGIIVDVVYPDDQRSRSRAHLEYIVKVNGRDVPGCSDIRNRGAIYNYSEKTRKIPEKSLEHKIDQSVLDENYDSEFVYVLFLNGDADYPIIIGSDEHPRHPDYKKISMADGKLDRDEFNGVEVKIDKDSNYTIEQLGRKDPDGDIENENAVGAKVKISGEDGSITAFSPSTITLENGDGKKFVLSDKQTLGAGGEALLKGDTVVSALNSFLQSVVTASGSVGLPPQNAAAIAQIGVAATILKAKLQTFKSKNSETD